LKLFDVTNIKSQQICASIHVTHVKSLYSPMVLHKPAFIMDQYGWLIRISHHLLVKSIKTTIKVGVVTICH